MQRSLVGLSLILCFASLWAQSPETAATPAGQAIADALAESTGSELAFVPAAALKLSGAGTPLIEHLLYPTDEVAVVALRGAQVRAALERSIGIFPTPNSGFLQISGLYVTANTSAASGKRTQSIRTETGPLDDSAVYKVAMPASLARGGLGYFKVWERDQIIGPAAVMTLEKAVGQKGLEASEPRWTINR